MNYYEARQRSDKSGWAWTVMNDGVIHTTGGCVTWPEGEPTTIADSLGPNPKPMGEPHAHPTREDAERCFYDHESTHLLETSMGNDVQRRCQYPTCENWTSKGLEARHLGDADLCDAHRNADGWRSAHPFHADISITSSY